uniref:Uncharacterized protein n=1 Tax=viral metagenome TaxID=1070528 RepID=A0A6M3JI04_9ZZZZ
MTFRQWCSSIWATGDKKEKSALASRKFLIMMLVAAVVVTTSYILVATLHVYSSSIVETGLQALERVAIAYFGVNVLEKAVDAYRIRSGGEV